jgi:formylglycine-generating enzyme required for sulfatase activity
MEPQEIAHVGSLPEQGCQLVFGQHIEIDPLGLLLSIARRHIANHPDQPVARIAWREATAFCGWLSGKTGLRVTLPTEAQWERAARMSPALRRWHRHRSHDMKHP